MGIKDLEPRLKERADGRDVDTFSPMWGNLSLSSDMHERAPAKERGECMFPGSRVFTDLFGQHIQNCLTSQAESYEVLQLLPGIL